MSKYVRVMNNSVMKSNLEKYINQDIDNPTYLFHGSPKKLEILKPNKSHDSNNNEDNIANSVFLFPSFIKATAYAFKDTIKENSKDLDWNFTISNNNNDFPVMTMENVNIDENIKGYIYVVEKDSNTIKDVNSLQYKCSKKMIPIDVIEINYKDYKHFYKIIEN